MVAESKYKPEYCEIAQEVLGNGKSLAAVCARLNICRATLYEWRDSNAEFAKALNQGLQKAQEYWEQIGEDGITGKIDKFGGAPWIFTMKNRFRADYQEDKDAKSDNTSLVEKLIDKLVDK